jgi:hypothetical protein
MSLIDVLDVVRTATSSSSPHRSGWIARVARLLRRKPGLPVRPALHFQLENPQPGDALDGHVLRLKGWICSPEERIQAILIEHPLHSQRLEVYLPRFDVAGDHPSAVGAPWVGFLGHVSTLGLPAETEFSLAALTASGQRWPLGAIRIRRRPLVSPYRPRYRPVLLYCFSRSGSSWTMRLLRQHPEALIAGDFPYEVRAGQYWARLAHLLSQPFGATIDPRPESAWHQFEPRGADGSQAGQTENWFGRDYVEHLVASMQTQIDQYYARIGSVLGCPEAACFVEKIVFPFSVRLMREIYPEVKVVFLVRDFRDMFCSVRSFNERRGFLSFGRELALSDEEFIHGLAQGVSAFHRDWLEFGDEAILLRYEDLVRQPHATLGQLFTRLDLDASPEVVAEVFAQATAETVGSDEHRTTATQEQSVGRWRAELSPDHRHAFRVAFGKLLEAFGYEPDSASTGVSRNPMDVLPPVRSGV